MDGYSVVCRSNLFLNSWLLGACVMWRCDCGVEEVNNANSVLTAVLREIVSRKYIFGTMRMDGASYDLM